MAHEGLSGSLLRTDLDQGGPEIQIAPGRSKISHLVQPARLALVGYNPAMRALLLAAIVLQSAASAQSANWPQFRGPNASGIAAADAAPPVEFSTSKRLLWKQP